MKKKIASMVLAAALVLPTSLTAFAATPSDVVGKPVQTAVEELTALGIIKGYEDGTFKPDNTITRAELAKIVVIGTGNESAASLMANVKPSFNDVKAGAWYTGYINVAAAKGFIKGFNGNFRPSDNIKFEEVVAILVRALGYQDKYLSGAWPYNVLLQADEIGLTDGISIATGTFANRGTVAELTSNTIGENLVTYDADGELYYIDADDNDVNDLLINKLGSSEDQVLTAASLNDDKQVDLDGTPTDTAAAFFVTNGKKLGELLGHTVSVLKNKDGDVLAVTDAQDAGDIVTGTIEDGTEIEQGMEFVINEDDEYTAVAPVGDDAPELFIYLNGDEVSVDDDATYEVDGDLDVTLLLNDGDVQAVLLTEWTADAVLEDVDTYTNYSKVTTDDAIFKVNAATVITLDGKASDVASLKENDVLNAVVNADGEAVQIVATRKSVSGELEFVGDEDGDVVYTLAGKEYVALDKFDDLDSDDVDTDYTFYLNKDGKVAFGEEAVDGVDNSQYAVIYTVNEDEFIIGNKLKPATEVVYYSLKDKKVVTELIEYVADADDIDEDDNTDELIKATDIAVDDAGQLVELDVVDDVLVLGEGATSDLDVAGLAVNAVTASKLTLENGDTDLNYVLNSNTAYLEVEIDGADSTVEAIEASKITEDDLVVVNQSAGVAKYVVLITDAESETDLDAVYGLYVSKSSKVNADGATYSVKLNVNGTVTPFELTETAYGQLTGVEALDAVALDAVEGATDGYENLAFFGNDDADEYLGAATVDKDDKTITTAGNDYLVTGNTKIYVLNSDQDAVTDGTFTDVRQAAEDDAQGTDYELLVVGNGAVYDNFEEAAIIFVIELP